MGLPNKCCQGHVYFGQECQYCRIEKQRSDELFDLVNDEDEKREL